MLSLMAAGITGMAAGDLKYHGHIPVFRATMDMLSTQYMSENVIQND